MKIVTETTIEIPDPPDKFRIVGKQRATVGVETMQEGELDAIGKEWLDKLKKRAALLRKSGEKDAGAGG